MEILILILLYYFSQKPDFLDNVKPLMEKLKSSEQLLSFLKDLSKFSEVFGYASAKSDKNPSQEKPLHDNEQAKTEENKKTPQSPTQGIADDFIQSLLDNYLKNNP